MSKVITFSTNFQKGHPRAGRPTHFVEALCKGFPEYSSDEYTPLKSEPWKDIFSLLPIAIDKLSEIEPKYHTIRNGHRWKVGDKFSPRVWSGKPYKSKQVIIAPDVTIIKLWDIEIDINGVISINGKYVDEGMEEILAKNDGLSQLDFFHWLVKPCMKTEKPFSGQIICWDNSIEY